jgi:hypothetical protein
MSRPAVARAVGGVMSRDFHFTGAVTVTGGITGLLKTIIGQSARILGVTLQYRAKGGTHVATAVDVKVGGTSILAATFDVDATAAGTLMHAEGTGLAAGAASVAKDATLQVDVTEAGGTTPTITDMTLQIDYLPLGD